MTQDRITIWLDRPLRKKLKEHVKKMRKTDPTSSASGLVRQLLRECLK